MRKLKARRGMEWGLHAVVGVLGALLAVWIFGRAVYSWGPARVRVSVAPAWRGDTTIVLTPVGEITARTHRAPVRLTVELARLNTPVIRAMARELPDANSVVADLERCARRSARGYAARILLLALLGGPLASALLLRGPLLRHAVSGLAGLGAVAILFAVIALTFDRGAFASPRYTGPLAEAPGAVRFARDGLARLNRLRGRMDTITASLARFYASLGDSGPRLPRDTDVRVLHISDLHNNPLAVGFIEKLALRFRVDLIVNTGDLTDYGTEVEEALLEPLRGLPVPQLFISGNHDSRSTLRAVSRIPGVRVLDGEIVETEGIRFLGWGDPVSEREGYGRVDAAPDDLDALEAVIRQKLATLEKPPDVLLVHHHRLAQRLKGLAPVILYGHDHRPAVRRTPQTVFIGAGTTGGAGARYFHAREGVPYSAAILHFSRETPGHLLAADLLHVHGPEGEFALQRYMLNGIVADNNEAIVP